MLACTKCLYTNKEIWRQYRTVPSSFDDPQASTQQSAANDVEEFATAEPIVVGPTSSTPTNDPGWKGTSTRALTAAIGPNVSDTENLTPVRANWFRQDGQRTQSRYLRASERA